MLVTEASKGPCRSERALELIVMPLGVKLVTDVWES